MLLVFTGACAIHSAGHTGDRARTSARALRLGGLPHSVFRVSGRPHGAARQAAEYTRPKGHVGRQTDRSTPPRGSSLCRSVVPLIGLTTLQWALGAAMPSSTHSNSPGVAGVLGDQETAARRKWRADLS